MVITLLAIILLAALIFYVMNLGQSTKARLNAQHAADTTAIGGAAWVARTFNLVALNNTSMARTIAMINVIDPMPRAVRSSLIDQQSLSDILQSQLARGVPGTYLRDTIEEVSNEVTGEVETLTDMDELFDSFDVTRITHYDGPDGIGAAWRSLYAMDELNQAAMEDLGSLTQLNATNAGLVNLRGDSRQERAALLLPVRPNVPWTRGRFDDFERPVRQGLLPEASDDPETRRGPWDTVFGWRWINRAVVPGSTPSPNPNPQPPSNGNVPIGSGSPSNGGGSRPRFPVSYSAYGPQRWLLGRMGSLRDGELRYARFAHGWGGGYSVGNTFYWLDRMARINLEYLWPGGEPQSAIDPRWELSFANAAAMSDDEINHTRFVIVEIKSRYARADPRFLTPGSWTHVSEEGRFSPRVHYVGGWTDPREWGVEQPVQHIWRDEWTYPVYSDPSIGIEPAFDEENNAVPQPVYRVDHFMFAGVEYGEESEVRSPHNFIDRNALPAPTDLVHSQVSMNEDNSGIDELTFLGIAQQRHRALMWPGRFTSASPHPYAVGIAQAGVFNNHSFDLWTQMWHAQLERVQPIDQWVGIMQSDAGLAGGSTDLSAEQYNQLQAYLESVEPLGDLMLSH